MSLVAAAVCPHPPMLVPEIASGAAAELDTLRDACAAVVRQLLDAGTQLLNVVGMDPAAMVSQHRPTTSFARFGVPLRLEPDRTTALASAPLPLSLSIATWLLRDVAASVDTRLYGLAPDLTPQQYAQWVLDAPGFDDDRPWALLAMGDGSACRSEKAPGYFDPGAGAFDDAAAAAFAGADTNALLAIEAATADRLWCAGRPAWQVLAGAIAADGRPWRGEVLYDEAPYGVGYLAAVLTPSGRTS